MFKRKPKMTVADIAALLNVPLIKVERWVRQGKIPCKISGDVFQFDKTEVIRWAEEHDLNMLDPVEGAEIKKEPPPPTVTLVEAVSRGGIFYGLPGDDSSAALTHAVERLEFPNPSDKPKMLQEILRRESIASTGIGQGVALPHLRDVKFLHIQHPIISIFFLEHPIDFTAIDGELVHVLFMLFCPNPDSHLKILSRLSFCLQIPSFRTQLKTQAPRETLIAKMEEIDIRLNKII